MFKKILLLFLLLCIGTGLAYQFWLKPTVEKEASASLAEILRMQGLEAKEPIKASLATFTRTLSIEPFEVKPIPLLGLEAGRFAPSRVRLTWYGLLACTEYGKKWLPKEGDVKLVEEGLLDALSIKAKQASMTCSNLAVEDVSLPAQTLLRFLNSQDAPNMRPPFSFSRMKVGKTEIEANEPKKINLHLGPMTMEGLSQTKLATLLIRDMLIQENGQEMLRLGSLRQEDIQLFSQDEWATLIAKMSLGSSQKQQDALIDLFCGDKPLVGYTEITDLLATVEKNPLKIHQIT
ncbi:MAG: hypothetical protein J5803_03525, partial [Desulfovibrio sp.]|nr:hypothetical protein [Desulfovibrio sp.]